MSAAVPIHAVTGFLGAGKTTLINRLARAAEFADTLVIVNEFGEIGLDHLLYENVAGDAILLASGCVCCELRGDLIDGLGAALQRRDDGALAFSRILLETSGLADPAPILHALLADPVLSRRLRLAAVDTVVDAVNGRSTLEAHGEARRQVALADRLLLSKSELSEDLTPLRAALAAINPAAPLVDLAEGLWGAREFLADVARVPKRVSPMAVHDGDVRARSYSTVAPIESPAFARFLRLLEATLGPKLLRVKALVEERGASDRPWLIESAQHFMARPRRVDRWPGPRHETVLVVISDGLDPEAVERLWRALTDLPQVDRADFAAIMDNPLAPRRAGLLA